MSPTSFPPEPWQLGGSMVVSLWRVPIADLPASLAAALPTGAAPVSVGGRVALGTAFVRYEPGSVLTYDELLAAVLVRHGRRLRITIPDIWVDSPASVAGGRQLWGIPKSLASFDRAPVGRDGLELRAAADGRVLAEARVVGGRRLPGWWRSPLPTAQRLEGVERSTRVQSLARVRQARASWRFPEGSPLGYLAGRRPVVSVLLEEMSVSFGTRPGARAGRTRSGRP